MKRRQREEEGGEREREREREREKDLPSAFFIVDRCNSSSGCVWLCSWGCFFGAEKKDREGGFGGKRF